MSAPLPRAERLAIAGPAGALEVLLEEPPAPRADRFGILCHPHPLMGGTLDNKVVYTLARALQALRVPTVRFNYRGVGASAGQFADGIGETDDALAAVEFGRTRWPGARPWLLGFSFGGVIAIRAAERALPERLVAVAPAVDRLGPVPLAPNCPWLIVVGEADDVVAPPVVLEWAGRLQPPASLVTLPGVGHFFHGHLNELREAVISFAQA